MVEVIAATVWGWLERLGGIGLILLGFVDNSPLPVPGGMDALTVILAAHQKKWWWYYAIMATIGGVVSTATHFMLRAYKEQGFILASEEASSDKPPVSA